MSSDFHERFKIQVDLDEAKRRFINRIKGSIYESFIYSLPDSKATKKKALFYFGEKDRHGYSLEQFVGEDFYNHLRMLEAIYRACSNSTHRRDKLDDLIKDSLILSEVDLGVRWKEGRFLPSGAELLDERLVNDSLRWLSKPEHESVLNPFQKGLDHFLRSQSDPKLRADVVTDMYEAVEALAKKVTGKDRDLSANRELFIKKVKASEDYKNILREYIDFACKFRHAPGEKKPKPNLSERETESFIYLTGLFIRLGMD